MNALACIGEPVSWLRLERHALGASDAAITSHVASCTACRQCLDEVRRESIALPPLVLPVRAARRPRWWWLAVPAVAAAVIAIVVVRPSPEPRDERVATVKGIGDVTVGVVRDRDGAIRDDVLTFAPGDRWKVVVTCAPGNDAWIDVAVVEDGARAADHPLAAARVACGNGVVVPGAFTINGRKPNRVCARVAAGAAPDRAMPLIGERDVGCVILSPE